jgi:hypothetical protein
MTYVMSLYPPSQVSSNDPGRPSDIRKLCIWFVRAFQTTRLDLFLFLFVFRTINFCMNCQFDIVAVKNLTFKMSPTINLQNCFGPCFRASCRMLCVKERTHRTADGSHPVFGVVKQRDSWAVGWVCVVCSGGDLCTRVSAFGCSLTCRVLCRQHVV